MNNDTQTPQATCTETVAKAFGLDKLPESLCKVIPDTPKQTACEIVFKTDFAPELCISKDATRYVLNYVHLDEKERCFVTTDGSMMSITPVSFENESSVSVSGYYSVAQIVKAKKLAKRADVASLIVSKDSITFSDGSSEPRLKADAIGTYPNYKMVLPKAEKRAHFKVCLDADLLLKIAKAIGCKGKRKDSRNITLSFSSDAGDSILLSNDNERLATGILMPCKIQGAK